MARRVWTIGLGLGTATLLALSFVPSLRLNAELAAARREGLLTNAVEVRQALGTVPEAQNAAPLILQAIASRKGVRTSPAETKALGAVLKGSETATQRETIRRQLAAQGPTLDLWRQASRRPRLDYQRRWEEGYSMLLPEYAGIRQGVRSLIAAARIGMAPEENLRVAARLTALERQEPLLIAQVAAIHDAQEVLATARRRGLGRRIEADLGPPPDVRWATRLEAMAILESVDGIRRHDPAYGKLSVLDGALSSDAFAASTKVAALRAYRGLLRDLPQKATDYAQARTAVLRWVPQAQDAVARFPVLGRLAAYSVDTASYVDEFEALEKERAAARAGR